MKAKYLSANIRVVANGWEVDVLRDSWGRGNDDPRQALNTYAFNNFDEMSKWLKANLRVLATEE